MKTKPVIGIFGKRNVGKSSFINALTNQEVAIVSPQPGTTTDPVKKTIELFGIGPVVLVDTAGIDDSGDLGDLRIKKTKAIIKTIDLAILLITDNAFDEFEKGLVNQFNEFGIPYFFIHHKSDIFPLSDSFNEIIGKAFNTQILDFSSIKPQNNNNILSLINEKIPETVYNHPSIIGDLLSYGDIVMLITPIDNEAPEGRLILPQVQIIRDLLDNDCVAIVLKESEVNAFLKKTGIKPKLVITDSQVFLKADTMIPNEIPLTGFSIVLARYKGDFQAYLKGTPKISELKDGDRILILESCSHQVTCDDIGRVKIPSWLSNFTGKNLKFDVVTGLNELPQEIKQYALVIQCGGCMITRKQLINRLKPAIEAGIPVTNYGMAIAYTQGVYHRAIKPFVKNGSQRSEYFYT